MAVSYTHLAGSYLADLPALRHLASVQELPLTRRVTFLVGENGTGKSVSYTHLDVYKRQPAIPGNFPYREGGAGTFHPKTSDACVHCGLCVRDVYKRQHGKGAPLTDFCHLHMPPFSKAEIQEGVEGAVD